MTRRNSRARHQASGTERLSEQYAALCGSSEAAKPNVSNLGTQIFDPILQAFSGYVLPHRADDRPTFTDEECRLYVNKREWLVKVPSTSVPDENRYEQMMEALFWGAGPFGNLVEPKKLIFIAGTIGSGKSTFTDYYLRCFCPHHSNRSASFKEKLIIHFDLKNRTSHQAVDDKMWEDLSHSLSRAGIDAGQVADFEGEQNPTQRLIRTVLRKVSRSLKAGEFGEKKYLIIVVDNIDQSPLDCQSYSLMLVQDLIQVGSGVDVWKILFPLWPQTLSRLRRESRLTVKETEYFEVELGHLDLSDFYRRKLDYLNDRYRRDTDHRASKLLDEVTYLAREKYKDVLRDLSYGNFLVMDDLIVNMLRSNELVEHEVRGALEHLTDYRFYDSLITGVTKYHCQTSSNILNPFGWHNSPESEQHVLILPYLMQYLSHEAEHNESSVADYFQAHGFRRSLVMEALHKMDQHHMLHFEGDGVINPHRKVLRAYTRLIQEPAAVDNFAITTPVRRKSITDRWVMTKGFVPAQFFARCLTTVLFLKEVFALEVRIDSLIQARGGDLDAFRSRVPSIAGKVRSKYNERLISAKQFRWPTNANVTDRQWKELEID